MHLFWMFDMSLVAILDRLALLVTLIALYALLEDTPRNQARSEPKHAPE